MTKLRLSQFGTGQIVTIACEYAHVRDGCLVYAEEGDADTAHYVPVGQIDGEFTITRVPPPVEPTPVSGSGATAVFPGRPRPTT